MADLKNYINLKNVCFTLNIKVNHQGQVTENIFSEILDIENVKINTKIESLAGI